MMHLRITDSTELPSAAQQLLDAFPRQRVFAFFGEMGSGKTTFIKAICARLGVKSSTSSPTFALVNEYISPSAGKIYHFDLYRLKNSEEALDIGCEEYFYSGNYCFIEWPEKVQEMLPRNTVTVRISVEGTERNIEVFGH